MYVCGVSVAILAHAIWLKHFRQAQQPSPRQKCAIANKHPIFYVDVSKVNRIYVFSKDKGVRIAAQPWPGVWIQHTGSGWQGWLHKEKTVKKVEKKVIKKQMKKSVKKGKFAKSIKKSLKAKK